MFIMCVSNVVKLTSPRIQQMYDVWFGGSTSICFINVFTYLLKLIHIHHAYNTLNTNGLWIAKLLNYKHFSAGVPYAASYALKYIQGSAINVLKTNQNIK